MVDCLYDPMKIEDWHEDYGGEGQSQHVHHGGKLARAWG
jgi:hypothetical protein